MKESKAAYFVEVQDHIALRRNILQSLRDILDSLQKFHDFQKKKEQKARKVAELKAIINRTNTLFLKLKGSLPEVAIPKLPREKKGKQQESSQPRDLAPSQKEPSRQPKQKSELDALEEELSAIERKLNKLV